ncbi:MAG TPA: GNAT family N-acetyltransferase [Gemmatimonadaceae bacterium]
MPAVPDAPPPVRRATAADAPLIAPLFDAYRRFYDQPSDLARAERYLRERLERGESVVFVAHAGDDGAAHALGFVQLYPLFSSIGMQRIWVLNDLFVDVHARGRGVALALLDAARDHATSTGASRIVLSTAPSNHPARALYERLGYRASEGFMEYVLELPSTG